MKQLQCVLLGKSMPSVLNLFLYRFIETAASIPVSAFIYTAFFANSAIVSSTEINSKNAANVANLLMFFCKMQKYVT